MPAARLPKFGSIAFLLSLSVIAALALGPELFLFIPNHEDIRKFAPIAYYIAIISFLLVTPALWLPSIASRVWVIFVGLTTLVASLIVGFQAVSIGARWDLTAHAAMMQTYPKQVADFSAFFGSNIRLLWLVALALAFLVAIFVNVRSERPSRKIAAIWTLVGLLVSMQGLHNFWVFGRPIIRTVKISDHADLRIAEVSLNSYHPVTRLLLTHYNYEVTHSYYIDAYRRASENSDQLKGTQPVSGATVPRIVLVVIGESASRRHWSLYGYGRDTNPAIRALGDEVLLFSDIISTCVGTQAAIRAMFDTSVSNIPVFPVFTDAGFKTHWFSTKHDQGIHDVEIAALVQACDQRVFLNGAYDETLIPLVEKAIATPGRHIIFLNLFGSHVRYQDRYPTDQTVFRGEGRKDDLIATYDNSIRYTDQVLAQLIEVLKQQREPSIFLYVSDHAEDIYDSTPDAYLFRSDSLATNPMYEVPFFVWASPEFRSANADFMTNVAKARNKPFTTNGLYHTVIDLARLTNPVADPAKSYFSPDYEETERYVGAAKRLYTK